MSTAAAVVVAAAFGTDSVGNAAEALRCRMAGRNDCRCRSRCCESGVDSRDDEYDLRAVWSAAAAAAAAASNRVLVRREMRFWRWRAE